MVRPILPSKILAAAACATAIAISAKPVAAEASYEMISYVESPSGRRLISGDYGGAIALASKRAGAGGIETRLIESTNLCVAYTVTGSFAEAHEACATALDMAKRIDGAGSHMAFRSESETAKAMTNRGVLKAVTGDATGAESDFREAAAMNGTSTASGRNLAYLETAAAADRLAMTTEP